MGRLGALGDLGRGIPVLAGQGLAEQPAQAKEGGILAPGPLPRFHGSKETSALADQTYGR